MGNAQPTNAVGEEPRWQRGDHDMMARHERGPPPPPQDPLRRTEVPRREAAPPYHPQRSVSHHLRRSAAARHSRSTVASQVASSSTSAPSVHHGVSRIPASERLGPRCEHRERTPLGAEVQARPDAARAQRAAAEAQAPNETTAIERELQELRSRLQRMEEARPNPARQTYNTECALSEQIMAMRLPRNFVMPTIDA